MRHVAERRLSPAGYCQSSLCDEGSLGALNRGLKATATITKSLRDSGTAQGKKPNPCHQLNPDRKRLKTSTHEVSFETVNFRCLQQ
jgi:hypothetical protein